MKLENIEKLSTAHREYKHLQKTRDLIINSDKQIVELVTTTKTPAGDLRQSTHIPLDRFDLLNIIQQKIDSKEIELYNLGVEDFKFDKGAKIRVGDLFAVDTPSSIRTVTESLFQGGNDYE